MSTEETRTQRLAGFIGEGVHTSLRKYCESEASNKAWHAIQDMPGDEWAMVLNVVAAEIEKAFAPKLEILVVRDPDMLTETTMYVDGVEIHGYVEEDVDPGAGYSQADWDERTQAVRDADYSPAFKAAVVESRVGFRTNQFISEQEG